MEWKKNSSIEKIYICSFLPYLFYVFFECRFGSRVAFCGSAMWKYHFLHVDHCFSGSVAVVEEIVRQHIVKIGTTQQSHDNFIVFFCNRT